MGLGEVLREVKPGEPVMAAQFNRMVRAVNLMNSFDGPGGMLQDRLRLVRLTEDIGPNRTQRSKRTGKVVYFDKDATAEADFWVDSNYEVPVILDPNDSKLTPEHGLPYDTSDVLLCWWNRQAGAYIPIDRPLIRHGITSKNPGGGTYPVVGDFPDTYGLDFADVSYTETMGAQGHTATAKTSGPHAFVHNLADPLDTNTFIPEGTLIWVFWAQGQWYTFFEHNVIEESSSSSSESTSSSQSSDFNTVLVYEPTASIVNGSHLRLPKTRIEFDEVGNFIFATSEGNDDIVLPVPFGFCGGRITASIGNALPTSDVTAAGTIFLEPFLSDVIELFDGTDWRQLELPSTKPSIAVPASATAIFDVFAFDSSGTVTLELSAAWASATARTGSLTLQNGVQVKSGTPTRLYLGSFRTVLASQTEDSETKRFVWNFYNQAPRKLKKKDSTASWTYTTNAYRQANAQAANQVEVVNGLLGRAWIELRNEFLVSKSLAATQAWIGIGEDRTNGTDADIFTEHVSHTGSITDFGSPHASLRKYVPLGHHIYAMVENMNGGTATFFSNLTGATSQTESGLLGYIMG